MDWIFLLISGVLKQKGMLLENSRAIAHLQNQQKSTRSQLFQRKFTKYLIVKCFRRKYLYVEL